MSDDLREWVKSEIRRVESMAEEAKLIGLAAKDHPCAQGNILTDLRSRVGSWDKWWKATVVSILLAIVSIGGFVWMTGSKTAVVETKMNAVEDSMKSLEVKVDKVVSQQYEFGQTVETIRDNKSELAVELKRAVREAILETDYRKNSHGK
jgi:hypothetical protein